MDASHLILIVEDEKPARTLLHVTLAHEGYVCALAMTGEEAIVAAVERDPAVILLDLGLPDMDGVEVTRQVRERSLVPIIVVSARHQEAQKIAALDEGANDYVTKPFAPGELLARIRVALRNRSAVEPKDTGHFTEGDLTVDFDRRRVTLFGREVRLTPIEYRLLTLMVRSRGRVLSHRHILRQVWGPRCQDQVGYLRVYMKKLREKLESEPARPKYLLNEPGVGYRFCVSE